MKVSTIVCVSVFLFSMIVAGPAKRTAKHALFISGKPAPRPLISSVHINHPDREEFNVCTKEIKDNVKTLRDLFYKGDTNQDGVLSREEYLTIALEVFNKGREHPFSQEQCERWFDALDMNQNGVLSQREFIPLSAVAASFFDDAYMATHPGKQ